MSAVGSRHGRIGFPQLLIGASLAPLFWLGQLLLSYTISALACFRADTPNLLTSAGPLRSAFVVFDIVAVIAGLLGLSVSYASWRAATRESGRTAGRTRFLGLWGIFSSLCFLIAILFTAIASLWAPLCLR